MKYVSLFSGIEAATVAWEPLGWEPLAFSEIDAFPCAVLAERFPDVPNLGDITKIDWKKAVKAYGKPDLVVGGSPCQAFSVAGLREGLKDPRGNLMLEWLRVVAEVKPEFALWENVPGVPGHAEVQGHRQFDGGKCDAVDRREDSGGRRMSYLAKTPKGLLPCPFCGGEAEFETYGGTACAVTCRKCRCGTPTVSLNDGERAVEAWNRRAERTCRWQLVEGTLFATECGEAFHRVVPDNYCPNCGSRITEVER